MVIRNTIRDGQITLIHSIAHYKRMDKTKLRKITMGFFGKEHIRELTHEEASALVSHLNKQKALPKKGVPVKMSEAQRYKINAIYERILSKGKIYELENLCRRITKVELEKLNSITASKLIRGLEGILTNIKDLTGDRR